MRIVGHLELCEYFVSVGAVIDQPDKSGRTPLHWAAIAGHTEIVKFLLSKGANILAETANKMNALHGAVEGSKNDTVKALMDAVASDEGLKLSLCNAKNSDDKTSWDIAMGAKNQGLCTILKEMGDPNGASASCVIS
jgi:ankyrin repeat protein